MIHSTTTAYSPVTKELPGFFQDCLHLFTGNKQGHMEVWEYGESEYKGDPAGGADHWAELIKNPGHYYPTLEEVNLIDLVINSESCSTFSNIKTIVEFGPGSIDAIRKKTLPFISMCPLLDCYVTVDTSIDQGNAACHFIRTIKGIRTKQIVADFAQEIFQRTWDGPSAYIMWGCTIGNLSGSSRQNPYSTLIKEIEQLQRTLLVGDHLVLIFDTNNDKETVLRAYNEPALKRQSLSWLYGLKREGIATGNFDPRVWAHDPVWFPDVMQCAHTIFPMFDQTLTIGGHTIKIPAWRRFVSNNSYKFRPNIMIAAAKEAGLKAQVIQHGPMAMLIAGK